MDGELLKPKQSDELQPLSEEDISPEQKQFLRQDSELLYEGLILLAKYNLNENAGDIGYAAYTVDDGVEDITLPEVTDVLVWINLDGDKQLQITRGVQEEYCTQQGDWALGINEPSEKPDFDRFQYTIALWKSGHTEIESEFIKNNGSFKSVIPLKRDYDRLRGVVVQVLAELGRV